MKRSASILTALALFTVASLVLVSATPAGPADAKPCVPPAGKQCVVMETRERGPVGGTFSLTPTGPGPLKSDSGMYSSTYSTKKVVREGQLVIIYTGTATGRGRRGTFVLRERFDQFAAGSGYAANTGVWSLVRARGRGQYAGLSGSGRLAGVSTPQRRIFFRFEGFVIKP